MNVFLGLAQLARRVPGVHPVRSPASPHCPRGPCGRLDQGGAGDQGHWRSNVAVPEGVARKCLSGTTGQVPFVLPDICSGSLTPLSRRPALSPLSVGWSTSCDCRIHSAAGLVRTQTGGRGQGSRKTHLYNQIASIPLTSHQYQATKGTRGMPRHVGPMKDVADCDKPRGAASRLRSVDLRMGQPARGHARAPRA